MARRIDNGRVEQAVTREIANDPRIRRYHRMAALITTEPVLHAEEKRALVEMERFWRRKASRQRSEAEWCVIEERAADESVAAVAAYRRVIDALDAALERVHSFGSVRVQAKVEDERARLTRARTALAGMETALAAHDFGAAGKALQDADKELWAFGGSLLVELRGVSFSRDLQTVLADNQRQRREARTAVENVRRTRGEREALLASVQAYELMAAGLVVTADVLAQQVQLQEPTRRLARVGDENSIRVVPAQELERLDDVGGLEGLKEQLRRTLGMRLERPEEAARYGVGSGNTLFYGPPGTGKTLLARAVAGEFGLRFLRVVPAVIASPYAHETARNLARVFDLARQSAPCLLFLDELDSLASARSGLPSAEHREIVSQLLTLLEECRAVPRLVVMAATNAIELLDPALREGRFDSKLPVPLPDAQARRHILEIHLRRRAAAVVWESVDLDELVRRTSGRSGAALEALVNVAAEHALQEGASITQTDLLAAVHEREARDRITLEMPVRWEDVVLPSPLEQRLRQIMRVVQHPELVDVAGITPPAGIILHGPPGTGKTTIAKAMATEVRASFYEMSAADLLSKWVGESEERVAKLFARARENRPSIIFIDEIDGLLRRRSAGSVAPWEERIVSQFLRELDGLRAQTGVFLVGATNRLDIIDEAIRERRLAPLEVPLPDIEGRRALLGKLFARSQVSGALDLDAIAVATEGMSGADLKNLRDEVGMKALGRVIIDDDGVPDDLEVTAQDVAEALRDRRGSVANQEAVHRTVQMR